MTAPNISASRARRYIGPARFGAYYEIVSATPDILKTPFLVNTTLTGHDKEYLVRVASLTDLVSGGYAVKPLNVFVDAGVDLSAWSIAADDKLYISAGIPPEWPSASPQFTVARVEGSGLVVTEPFAWAVRGGLEWQVKRGSNLMAQGTAGSTQRLGGDGPCLTDRFLAVHADPVSALNYMSATETYLDSLAKSAGLDGDQFLNFGGRLDPNISFPL